MTRNEELYERYQKGEIRKKLSSDYKISIQRIYEIVRRIAKNRGEQLNRIEASCKYKK